MDTKNNHIKFSKEKDKLNKSYKEYNLGKILAMDLIHEIYVNPPLPLKTLRYFFLAYNFKSIAKTEQNKTLFSIGRYNRKDYYEILDYVRERSSSSLLFDFAKQKPSLYINLKTLIYSLTHIFKHSTLSFKSKLFLSSQLCFYLNTIENLERNSPVFKNYCAFSGIHHLEAIMTYYFKKNKKLTYSLQHGVYYVFKENIPLDFILYENFLSDVQLCWGQYTVDEYSKFGISKESLFAAGYPRKTIRKNPPRFLNKKKCVVLLARYTFESSNALLISIIEQFVTALNVDISIKLHPSLNHSYYSDLCSSLGWELISNHLTISDIFSRQEFGWAIAVNTAAYYEAYLNYIPCLRYNDGSFEDSLNVFEDNFDNLEQLKSLYSELPFENEIGLKEYFNLADRRLNYILGLGEDKYSILNGTS